MTLRNKGEKFLKFIQLAELVQGIAVQTADPKDQGSNPDGAEVEKGGGDERAGADDDEDGGGEFLGGGSFAGEGESAKYRKNIF